MTTEVFVYGDYTCPPEWRSYDDGGTFHKVYYIRGGDAIYHDADMDHPLKKNHLYIFPMYHKYHITHDPEHPLQVLWMHVSCFLPLTFRPLEIPMEDNSIESRFLEIISTAMFERPELLPSLSSTLLDMLAEQLPGTIRADQRINQILEAIYEHNFITNEELAKISSYNPSYMIRLFKQQMGITPQQYAIHQRINKAKKLLSEGKSVTETAELLSFSDANVFSRDFSRTCGYAPSEFKKQHMWGNA